MGLLSSIFGGGGDSVSSATTKTSDNRTVLDGDAGVFLSPESSITTTYHGNVGIESDAVNDIVSNIMESDAKTTELMASLTRSVTDSLGKSQTQLTDIVNEIKSPEGSSWQKALPYAVMGLAAFLIMKR